jgi:hypothetical protein
MPTMPPVRKRKSYDDIKETDLVYSLFRDKIAPPDPLDAQRDGAAPSVPAKPTRKPAVARKATKSGKDRG